MQPPPPGCASKNFMIAERLLRAAARCAIILFETRILFRLVIFTFFEAVMLTFKCVERKCVLVAEIDTRDVTRIVRARGCTRRAIGENFTVTLGAKRPKIVSSD